MSAEARHLSRMVFGGTHLGISSIGANEPQPMNLVGATSPLPSPPLRGGEGEESLIGSGRLAYRMVVMSRCLLVALSVWLCLVGGAVTARAGRMQPALMTASGPVPVQEVAAGDLLQFLDGATLHGALQGMDAGRGLRWRHPDAKKAFDLQPAHVDFLQLPPTQPMTNSPNCHFRFFPANELRVAGFDE